MRQHWFEPLADHMGPAYLRYSFTKGTEQEVDALVDLMELEPGSRILDVGCGPGRHALALARRGFEIVGVDISRRFIALARDGAPENARFVVGDARRLEFEAEFDAAISLCQGAFGLSAGNGSTGDIDPAMAERELDEPILIAMARALRPGGRMAVSAFSSYFQLRYLEEGDDFDAGLGVNHETTAVRDEAGTARTADLWTTCFTPRELRLLARAVGLEPRAVYSVTPGDYGRYEATTDRPEFLLLAASV